MSGAVGGRLAAWGLRLWLGAALLFCSEILWWSNDPPGYDLPDWLALAAIYAALGALMLDLLVRFRVGDILGVLPVAGLYGLLHGALVSRSAFADLPMSLVSRPLGLHTLGGGLLALLLLWWLLERRGLPVTLGRAAALALVGLGWGVWVRWFPLLPGSGSPPPDPATVVTLVGLGLVALGGLLGLVGRWPVAGADALRLAWWEWLAVGGALVALYVATAWQGVLSPLDGVILGALAGYLVGVLFLQRGQSRRSFLGGLLPPRPVGPGTALLYAACLALPAAVGYSLPGEGPEGMPLQALTAIFIAFGLAWLPGASLAIGFRAYIRLFREQG